MFRNASCLAALLSVVAVPCAWAMPTIPPPHLHFTFNSDAEGWTFHTVAPALTAPDSSYDQYGRPGEPPSTGTLNITATDNYSNFGYWQSPTFELVPINGTTSDIMVPVVALDGSTVLKATYRVQTDLDNRTIVPEFRLRSTAENGQQSDVVVVDSHGEAFYSPYSHHDKEPALVFRPGPSVSRFNLSFDLVNFLPEDSAHATLRLDALDLEVVNPNAFHDPAPEKYFTFNSNTEGWSYHTIPGFVPPDGGYNSGLASLDMGTIGPDTISGQEPIVQPFQFGWWGSPESGAGLIQQRGGRMYYAEFTVGSDEEDPSVVPAFRCRINEANFQACAYTQISSTGGGQNSPFSGSPRKYTVYFPPNLTLGSGFLIFSWDMFSSVADEDSQESTLHLYDVKVFSIPTP